MKQATAIGQPHQNHPTTDQKVNKDNGAIERRPIIPNSTPKYHNIVRSDDLLCSNSQRLFKDWRSLAQIYKSGAFPGIHRRSN